MYHNSDFQLWVAKAYEKTSDARKEWIYTTLPPIHMLTTAEAKVNQYFWLFRYHMLELLLLK